MTLGEPSQRRVSVVLSGHDTVTSSTDPQAQVAFVVLALDSVSGSLPPIVSLTSARAPRALAAKRRPFASPSDAASEALSPKRTTDDVA